MTTTYIMPIGAVTAFAGDLANNTLLKKITDAGWLICDGSSYDQTAFPELFKAIGTVNGGDSTNFNVPDLRNRFLRGTARRSTIDPDSATRRAAAPGGATGNNTGTLQGAATGIPNNKWVLEAAGRHSHQIDGLTPKTAPAYQGQQFKMARSTKPGETNHGGAHLHQLAGFDPITAPIHMALYYIIKASEPVQIAGTTPAGAIVGFAGPMVDAPMNWLKCDGAAYPDYQHIALFNVVGYNYGASLGTIVAIQTWRVPELRGYFLRAAGYDTNRDPDASRRHPSNDAEEGISNKGNRIGTMQNYATASPRTLSVGLAGNHFHDVANLPTESRHCSYTIGNQSSCVKWANEVTISSEEGNHNHTVTGGDKETRPENIAVDFLIARDYLPQSAAPIGTVMAFGGEVKHYHILDSLERSGWLFCNGDSLDKNAFSALFEVIGAMYGESDNKFYLPDLRGYFIAGAGKVAVGTQMKTSTTGNAVNALITTTDGDHTHSIDHVPTESHVINLVASVELASHNPDSGRTAAAGDHTHPISGGDAESRPVNVYVNYIIRAR